MLVLQVFSNKEDTGVPSLQKFVHKVTELRRLQSTERLIRAVGRTVADMMGYLADQGTKVGHLQILGFFEYSGSVHFGVLTGQSCEKRGSGAL